MTDVVDEIIDHIIMLAKDVRIGTTNGDVPKVNAQTIIALAWLKACRENWEYLWREVPPEERAVYERARELAGEEADQITYAILGPPVFSRVPPPSGETCWPYERHATVIQAMMGGARPLWAHHVERARAMIAQEKAQEETRRKIMAGETVA